MLFLEPPSPELRRTLVLVSKVLQVMSLGNKFGDKEEFMKQFNSLVEENNDKMDAFYKNLLNKDKPCDSIKPDAKVPGSIYKDSLLLMVFLMNDGKKPNPPQPDQSPPPSSSHQREEQDHLSKSSPSHQASSHLEVPPSPPHQAPLEVLPPTQGVNLSRTPSVSPPPFYRHQGTLISQTPPPSSMHSSSPLLPSDQ